MNIKRYSFFHFLSLSFLTHFLFAVLVVASMPKLEKFTTIELQSGAIGVRSMGFKGSDPDQKKTQTKVVTKKYSKTLPVSKNGVPLSKEVVQSSSATGDLSASKASEGQAGSGNGASGSGSGSGKDTPLSRYVQKVVTLIENHKSYPSRARYLGQQGTVSLKIKVSHEGKVLEMDILDAPPYKMLVNAAKDTISGIGDFPEMPSDVTLETLTMNVPIRYELVE